jgi:L-asparaginase II
MRGLDTAMRRRDWRECHSSHPLKFGPIGLRRDDMDWPVSQEPKTNPILVRLVLGEATESVHRGAAAIVDSDGRVVHQWGDIDTPFYPHSALKLLWTLPLLESGAVDRFALTPEEIVLAASSHLGERRHVDLVARWLSRCGLSPNALKCGSQKPYSQDAAIELRTAGRPPSALHNNNSGKHAGFLTTALHFGEPLASYLEPNHPVQERLRDTVEEFSGSRDVRPPRAFERCGMPAYRLSLRALATAMARFADLPALTPSRRRAVETLVSAVGSHSELLVGAGRLSSMLCGTMRGQIVVKGGLEGSYAGALMKRRIGIALKIDDGAQRAADVALVALLSKLGELGEDWALYRRLLPGITTHHKKLIGKIVPVMLTEDQALAS